MTPDKVHFVGSIARDTVEEVFSTLGSVLGRRLRRVPDGEPGGRRLWISWQYPLLRAQPFLKPDTTQPNATTGFFPLLLPKMFRRLTFCLVNLGIREKREPLIRTFCQPAVVGNYRWKQSFKYRCRRLSL